MTLARRLPAWLRAHLLDIFPPEPMISPLVRDAISLGLTEDQAALLAEQYFALPRDIAT